MDRKTENMDRFVDFHRYPLDRLDTEPGRAFLQECREEIFSSDALLLPGFLNKGAISNLLRSARERSSPGHRMAGEFSPYSDNLSEDMDSTLPKGHPRLYRLPASHRFINGLEIPGESPLRVIYRDPRLTGFLQRVMGIPHLYPLADEMGCINLLVYEPGDCNGWHFDTTDFVLSIMLQPAISGGEYQFIPGLRSPNDENLEGVSHRMRFPDDPQGVRTAALEAGTLFLFKGKNTFHRVTAVEGGRDRIVAILSYHDTPGHLLSEGSRLAMYGRIR